MSGRRGKVLGASVFMVLYLLLGLPRSVVYGQVVDTVDLPFFDDFSSHLRTPYAGYWVHKEDVDCGEQVAIAPPTTGVAIFDALCGDGSFHLQHGAVGNACDTLVSRPLRLIGSDSVYLSFQFQPQGRGGQPQPADVLVVDFFDPVSRKWSEVWRASFDANAQQVSQHYSYSDGKVRIVSRKAPDLSQRFVKAHIPVVLPYRVRGFQFRFHNFVQVSKDTQLPGRQANTGHWSVDMVYVNAGRNAGDTVYVDDVACVGNLDGLRLPYQQIPYALATPWLVQLESNPSKYLHTQFVNLSSDVRVVGREFRIKDASGTLPVVGSSRPYFVQVNPGATEEFQRTYSYQWGALAGRAVDVTIEANLKVDMAANLAPFLWNDTVRQRVRFADVYAYDTGVPDNGYGVDGLSTAKACVAMRFEPIAAGTIDRVQVYFNPIVDLTSRTRFEIVFFNERNGQPGDELYAQMCDPPKAFEKDKPFVEYVLSSSVGFDEPIYVGLRQTKADMMQVGIDLHTPTPSRIVYNAVGTWEESRYKGALMIRLACSQGGSTPRVTGCDVESRIALRVFPNPARARVSVHGAPDGCVVELYSMLGEQIRSVRAAGGIVEMEVDGFPRGVYLVVVRGERNGILASERLVLL